MARRKPEYRPGWKRKPKHVSELLDTLIPGVGNRKRIAREMLIADWPELVGSALAAHSRPGELRGGTLIVNVDSAAWRHQLTLLADQILERVNERLGKELALKELRFSLGAEVNRGKPRGRFKR